jgi:uncharacterized iron-regulated membrane protein
MSWTHTWTGLVMGWLLFAIYVTGTLSFFRNEITVWMQPEVHRAQPVALEEIAFDRALAILAREAGDATQWSIMLPTARNPTLGLGWQNMQNAASGGPPEAEQAGRAEAGTERARGAQREGRPGRAREAGEPGGRERTESSAGPREAGQPRQQGEARQQQQGGGGGGGGGRGTRIVLDPASGEVLEARNTAGGNFLYRFHFELYGMDRVWGRWIVGVATMLMFIAIISGVVVHRNFFKDFFTFRPAKGKRSWLDGHNATGVLSLPFHIVITFSGLLLLAALLMPWPIDASYDGDRRAYMMEMRGMGAERAPGQMDARMDEGGSVALADLGRMYRQALRRWPGGVGSIAISDPGSAGARVEMRQAFGEQLSNRGIGDRLLFDGVSGQLLEAPAANPPTTVRSIWNVFIAVHEGRFAAPVARWLLFLSGLLGSFMVASGLVLWCISRQREREAGRLPRGHRFVEIMNVASVAGLLLAIGAYFWANRFIPAGAGERGEREILSFFAVWGLAFAHACCRRHKPAWVEQLSAAAALFLLLPVLNGLTGGAHLGQSLLRGQWQVAGFDLTALAFGALLLFIAHRLHVHVPRAARADAGKARAPGLAGAGESAPDAGIESPVAARSAEYCIEESA